MPLSTSKEIDLILKKLHFDACDYNCTDEEIIGYSKEAKQAIQNLIDLECLKARIAESNRWHRFGESDYDNELDEAIDERIEQLNTALKEKQG